MVSESFVRLLLLLREIPLSPRSIDTATLSGRLEAQGIRVTRRTLQRDLERLSRHLPIRCNDETKPYGWTWLERVGAARASGNETLREVAVRAAAGLKSRD